MEEDFVTYEQAIRLKLLGFDWDVSHFYTQEELHANNDTFWCDDGLVVYITDLMRDMNNSMVHVYSAPTLAQVTKWLREVKDIHIEIKYAINPQYEPWIGKVVIIEDYPEPNTIIDTDTCDTYEEALSECVDKAIEIIEKRNIH